VRPVPDGQHGLTLGLGIGLPVVGSRSEQETRLSRRRAHPCALRNGQKKPRMSGASRCHFYRPGQSQSAPASHRDFLEVTNLRPSRSLASCVVTDINHSGWNVGAAGPRPILKGRVSVHAHRSGRPRKGRPPSRARVDRPSFLVLRSLQGLCTFRIDCAAAPLMGSSQQEPYSTENVHQNRGVVTLHRLNPELVCIARRHKSDM
jgi:hypothetical protein